MKRGSSCHEACHICNVSVNRHKSNNHVSQELYRDGLPAAVWSIGVRGNCEDPAERSNYFWREPQTQERELSRLRFGRKKARVKESLKWYMQSAICHLRAQTLWLYSQGSWTYVSNLHQQYKSYFHFVICTMSRF